MRSAGVCLDPANAVVHGNSSHMYAALKAPQEQRDDLVSHSDLCPRLPPCPPPPRPLTLFSSSSPPPSERHISSSPSSSSQASFLFFHFQSLIPLNPPTPPHTHQPSPCPFSISTASVINNSSQCIKNISRVLPTVKEGGDEREGPRTANSILNKC